MGTDMVTSCKATMDDIQVDYIIRIDKTVKYTRYYTVLNNPYVKYYDTKVIYGGTLKIVANKVERRLRKWKEEKEAGKYEQGKHEVQKQFTGEEDSLPFY